MLNVNKCIHLASKNLPGNLLYGTEADILVENQESLSRILKRCTWLKCLKIRNVKDAVLIFISSLALTLLQ